MQKQRKQARTYAHTKARGNIVGLGISMEHVRQGDSWAPSNFYRTPEQEFWQT